MDQIRTPIIDMLRRFGDVSRGYFCIPSHHRGTSADNGFISLFGREVLKYDLTETPLTDDLHEAEGPIREAEELAADAFGADRSFFLVNGTTCGNEAMIISSVKEGEKILVAENCHKSALMGLIISGAKPVFIRPSVSPSFRAFSSVTPESVEKAFFENPDAKALFLTSPTFHGICSDIRSIAEICRRNNAYLLVDEAHGAHFAFSDRLPESAMSQGADMASQSIHKTGGSMTQSSMLHVKGGAERIAAVNEALKLVQSTSPSYILMASLDGARHSLAVRGRELTDAMLDTAEYIRKGINSVQGAICCGKDDSVFDADLSRLVFRINGLSGFELSDILFNESGICTEMCDNFSVVAIVGPGDSREDADRLINDVKSAAEKHRGSDAGFSLDSLPFLPPSVITPRAAFFSAVERVPFGESLGRICAEMIAPYPPGIPVIYPGQLMTPEVHSFISDALAKGRHIHGFSDGSGKTVKVIKK